jgi:hypothetical protein
VLPEPDVDTEKSFRNLPNVVIHYPGNLSTYDLIAADRVLFTTSALDVLTGEAPSAPAPGTPADEAPADEAPADEAGDEPGDEPTKEAEA